LVAVIILSREKSKEQATELCALFPHACALTAPLKQRIKQRLHTVQPLVEAKSAQQAGTVTRSRAARSATNAFANPRSQRCPIGRAAQLRWIASDLPESIELTIFELFSFVVQPWWNPSLCAARSTQRRSGGNQSPLRLHRKSFRDSCQRRIDDFGFRGSSVSAVTNWTVVSDLLLHHAAVWSHVVVASTALLSNKAPF
jgi:hypothetical protein